MNKKEIEKYTSALADYRVLCKCSHSVLIPHEMDKIICSWCGKYVFRDKKAEFKYRLREQLLKRM